MPTPNTPDARDALFQTDFTAEEFAARRGRICEAIGPKANALLQGAGPVRAYELFRQDNEFYYCCGVAVPQACLLIEGASRRASLYLPHRPPGRNAEGEALTAEDAGLIQARTGLDAVYGVELLSGHLNRAGVLYVPHGPAEGLKASRDTLRHGDALIAADPWDGRATRRQHFIDLLRRRQPAVELRDLTPVLDGLRAAKSPAELALLRCAGRLSAEAVTRAMRICRPGIYEYELGAMAQYVFLAGGARGEGYRAIIAGGANAWHAHYFRNDCPLNGGELVLMDVAPDYRYYTSDIGRMWPVSGTYAPWQRELYGFIVAYHKSVLAAIRPGRTADEIHAEAAEAMRPLVERTPFAKEVYRAAALRTLEFRGHLSHPVGMCVHDSGPYRDGPLRPGVVLTVDPQMWVPEEKLYIRCEDTVAVMEDGIENLTGAAPLEPDDVEALMRQGPASPPLG